MSFSAPKRGHVSQSAYWMYFGGNIVVAILLMAAGVYALIAGSLVTAAICVILLVPLGLFFRVIMMRRCRDIGWPAFLPWLTFGLGIIANMMIGSRVGANPASAGSAISVAMFFSVLDLLLMIVIGCLATKEQGQNLGGDYDPSYMEAFRSVGEVSAAAGAPSQPISSRAESSHSDSWDVAIAKRLAALSGDPAPDINHSPEADQFAPVPRAMGGFGRKGL